MLQYFPLVSFIKSLKMGNSKPVIANTLTNRLRKSTSNQPGRLGKFRISYSRKQKREGGFGDYTVSPSKEWESMRLDKKFRSKFHYVLNRTLLNVSSSRYII